MECTVQWIEVLNNHLSNFTWLTPPTTRRRSLMMMEEVEHRGKVMGANLSHFFFWGWKASTVSRAVGSWPGEHAQPEMHIYTMHLCFSWCIKSFNIKHKSLWISLRNNTAANHCFKHQLFLTKLSQDHQSGEECSFCPYRKNLMSSHIRSSQKPLLIGLLWHEWCSSGGEAKSI